MLALSFGHQLNVSLQVGDSVYYTDISPSDGGGFTTNNSAPKHLGRVESIDSSTTISVRCPYVDNSSFLIDTNVLNGTSHISFSKNKFVNNNNLLGYYGSVVLKNDSQDKVELFSVGSEVSESSK